MSTQRREVRLNGSIRSLNDGVYEASFASEIPCDMGWMVESLKMSGVDLNRAGSIPLLWNHDRDKLLGRIDSFEIRDAKLYGKFRWSTSDFAQQVKADVDAGIIQTTSLAYIVKQHAKKADGVMEATDWEMLEGSIVTIPADPSVGVGRSKQNQKSEAKPMAKKSRMGKKAEEAEEEKDTEIDIHVDEVEGDHPTTEIEVEGEEPETKSEDMDEDDKPKEKSHKSTKIQIKEQKMDHAKEIVELASLGVGTQEKAMEYILNGKSAEEYRQACKGVKPANVSTPVQLSAKEEREYDMAKAVRSLLRGKKENCLAFEISEQAARSAGVETEGFFIPFSKRSNDTLVSYSGTNAGAATIPMLAMPNIVDYLFAIDGFAKAGAKMMTGVSGNIKFAQDGVGLTVDKGTDVSIDSAASDALLTAIEFIPSNYNAYVDVTKQVIATATPDVMSYYMQKLFTGLSAEMATDAVANLVTQLSGISRTASGTWASANTPDGATFQKMVATVLGSNVDPKVPAFVGDIGIMSKLPITPAFTNATYPLSNALLYPTYYSSRHTGGTVYFGDWSEFLYMFFGAGIEIIVDPFTVSTKSEVRLVAQGLFCGKATRPQAFSFANNAST